MDKSYACSVCSLIPSMTIKHRGGRSNTRRFGAVRHGVTWRWFDPRIGGSKTSNIQIPKVKLWVLWIMNSRWRRCISKIYEVEGKVHWETAFAWCFQPFKSWKSFWAMPTSCRPQNHPLWSFLCCGQMTSKTFLAMGFHRKWPAGRLQFFRSFSLWWNKHEQT